VLTRSGVARALGRSIATVRRLEGSLLHPVRDARGVNRFNPSEVGDLVRRQQRGELALFARNAAPRTEELRSLRLENADLRRQLDELIEEITGVLDRLP
jgi:hypothetical protein